MGQTGGGQRALNSGAPTGASGLDGQVRIRREFKATVDLSAHSRSRRGKKKIRVVSKRARAFPRVGRSAGGIRRFRGLHARGASSNYGRQRTDPQVRVSRGGPPLQHSGHHLAARTPDNTTQRNCRSGRCPSPSGRECSPIEALYRGKKSQRGGKPGRRRDEKENGEVFHGPAFPARSAWRGRLKPHRRQAEITNALQIRWTKLLYFIGDLEKEGTLQGSLLEITAPFHEAAFIPLIIFWGPRFGLPRPRARAEQNSDAALAREPASWSSFKIPRETARRCKFQREQAGLQGTRKELAHRLAGKQIPRDRRKKRHAGARRTTGLLAGGVFTRKRLFQGGFDTTRLNGERA